MQRLKKTFAAITLTLVLAYSAPAGEIPCGVAAPPDQSQTTSQTTEQSTNSSSTTLDPVTEAALNLLQSLLTLI